MIAPSCQSGIQESSSFRSTLAWATQYASAGGTIVSRANTPTSAQPGLQ